MLPPVVAAGIRDLLGDLSDQDVIAVAKQVTEYAFRRRSEALQGLVEHSDNPRHILSRQKVRKQLLYDYAVKQGLRVKANATKIDIAEQLVEHWAALQERDDQKHGPKTQQHPPQPQHPGAAPSALAVRQPGHLQPYQQEGGADGGAVMPHIRQDDPNHLAKMFCEVFFGMFDPPSFSSDLFFDDCEFNLLVSPGGEPEQHRGSAAVVHRLFRLPQQDNVLFRPSEGGIRGMLEPHGLLAVEVHGTVHSPGAVIGHFQQRCLLAQDPFLQDTWRVRNINVECRLFPSS